MRPNPGAVKALKRRRALQIDSANTKAIAGVVRDFAPDVVFDLHEYGPSQPVIYDDALLWLLYYYNPTITSLSPVLMRPFSIASTMAIGMEAVDVLP